LLKHATNLIQQRCQPFKKEARDIIDNKGMTDKENKE